MLSVCSYHQKYLLQKYPNLLEDLEIEPGEDLLKSHVAARLNGYVGGYGTREAFDKECEDLALPVHVENYVRSLCKRK